MTDRYTRWLTPAGIANFKKRVEVTEDCWLWIGAKRPRYQARKSYELFIGPIPAAMSVRILCKVKNCVSPFHFDLVETKKEQSKLSWEKVWVIRNLHATGRFGCYKLGKKYGVHKTTISMVVKNRIWKEDLP